MTLNVIYISEYFSFFSCVYHIHTKKKVNLNDLNLKICKEVEILAITIDRNLDFKGNIKIFAEKQVKR